MDWGGNILKGRKKISSFTFRKCKKELTAICGQPRPGPVRCRVQWPGWSLEPAQSTLSLITAFLPARVSYPRRHSIVTFVTEGPECDGVSRGNITEALSDNKGIRQGMELS